MGSGQGQGSVCGSGSGIGQQSVLGSGLGQEFESGSGSGSSKGQALVWFRVSGLFWAGVWVRVLFWALGLA